VNLGRDRWSAERNLTDPVNYNGKHWPPGQFINVTPVFVVQPYDGQSKHKCEAEIGSQTAQAADFKHFPLLTPLALEPFVLISHGSTSSQGARARAK
jgi:hypothetical protein